MTTSFTTAFPIATSVTKTWTPAQPPAISVQLEEIGFSYSVAEF